MWLRKLDVSNFRNIEHASIELNPQLNYIVGRNGSGKSSLLEAVHCLSIGQSFRTNKALPIIRSGTSEAIIFGEVVSSQHLHRIGIKKSGHEGSTLRLDSNSSVTQSELASITPVVGITPEAEDLLEGGNKTRLSYLDWTLFHVEPTFREYWREYKRALKQRNAALRGKMPEKVVHSWDEALANSGEQINKLRIELIQRLVPEISSYLRTLLPHIPIDISYRKGWAKDLTLRQALINSTASDISSGFTHSGIHRADLLLKHQDKPLPERLSRGQRKLVVIALRLAQLADYISVTQKKPTIYIDDLPAELDSRSREAVLNALLALNIQVLITATSEQELPLHLTPHHAMFHVEQGVVANVV